jgi:hypothetical protein
LKAISPKLRNTTTGLAAWEWLPQSFADFLEEVRHVETHVRELGHLVLYRGHRERQWLLDSSFVRSCKRSVFGIEAWQKMKFNDFRLSAEHQQILPNLLLFKFDFVARPSQELEAHERIHGIDPWFEFLKRIQQYPEEDTSHLKGSFILDWTQSSDVAIYFANSSRQGEGALWIADVTATGKTLQTLKVKKILHIMAEAGSGNESLGVPLIFHPKKQLVQKRATNQEPVYIAQMDLRADLSEVWNNLETQRRSAKILLKIVLPGGTEHDCARYLAQKGMTDSFIFPG